MSDAMFRIEMALRSIGVLARYRLYSVDTQEFPSDFAPVPAYFRTLRCARQAARVLVECGCESEVEIIAVSGSEWLDWDSCWDASYRLVCRVA